VTTFGTGTGIPDLAELMIFAFGAREGADADETAFTGAAMIVCGARVALGLVMVGTLAALL
jgi:hypothetical protein